MGQNIKKICVCSTSVPYPQHDPRFPWKRGRGQAWECWCLVSTTVGLGQFDTAIDGCIGPQEVGSTVSVKGTSTWK